MASTDRLTRAAATGLSFKPQTRVTDPRFGDVVLFQHISDSKVWALGKEKACKTEQDCERDICQAKERMKLSHPSLMAMLDYSCELLADPQGAKYRVTGYYEYLPSNLETLIAAKAKTNSPFSSTELLRMAEGVLAGLAYLKSFKMIHSDVRPRYISVPDNLETGTYKLLDRLGDPLPPSKVQVNNFRKGRTVYFSPSLFEAIANHKPKIRHNPYKSDAFSFGLVLLEAGLLQSIQGIFNREAKVINTKELSKLQNDFAARYAHSETLKQVLFWLLNLDEAERKDAKGVLKAVGWHDLQSSVPTSLSDSSQIHHSNLDSVSGNQNRHVGADQGVQCQKAGSSRKESRQVFGNDVLLQPKRQNFLKQGQTMVILSVGKKEESSSVKEQDSTQRTGPHLDIADLGSEDESPAFPGHKDRQLPAIERLNLIGKLQEDSPEIASPQNPYSFRNAEATDERVRHTLDAETYELIRRSTQEGQKIVQPKTEAAEHQGQCMDLENSNFVKLNNRADLPNSQRMSGVPEEASDYFDFKLDTPTKLAPCDFFQMSTVKKDITDTPAFPRMTQGLPQSRQTQTTAEAPLEELMALQSPKSEAAHLPDHEVSRNVSVVTTSTRNTIILPAAVYVSNPQPIRIQVGASPAYRGETIDSSRSTSPIFIRQTIQAETVTPRASTMTYDFPSPNHFGTRLHPSENTPLNAKRESFVSVLRSTHNEGPAPATKEIYVSPVNFKKAQESSRMLGDVSAFPELESGAEVATHTYEVQNTGPSSRRYIFRRNSSVSVLQGNQARVSGNSSHLLADASQFHDGRSASPVPDHMNEKYLTERYGEVKLRVDNPRFQVYRRVDADVEHLRSHSQNSIRPPVKTSSFAKAIEAKF